MTVSIGDLELFNQEQVTLRMFNCKQFIEFVGIAASGSWKLIFKGETSASLAFNITAAQLRTALIDMTVITDITVAGNMTAGFTIEFVNEDGNQDQTPFSVSSNTLKTVGNIAVDIEIYYTARGFDRQGQYLSGVAVDSTIWANVQPLNGKELQQLPNYDADRETLKIFTKTELRTDYEIVRNTKTYEVNNVESWYGFYRALILEKKPSV